jgi:hypothetical protein
MPGHSQTSSLVATLADIPETNLVPAQFLTGGSVGAQIAYAGVTVLGSRCQPGYSRYP